MGMMDDDNDDLDSSEALHELFEDTDDEYGKFELIPLERRRSNRPDLHAFLMLDELFPGTGDIIGGAEHDEYYLDIDGEQLSTLTRDQVIELQRCGLRYDSDNDC